MQNHDRLLSKFIARLAKKIAIMYPNNCADKDDYIQAGHLKLAEINGHKDEKRNFQAYAIVAIARAMRGAALKAIGATSAPARIKKRIHQIGLAIATGKTEKDICIELGIDEQTLADMKTLIQAESWNDIFDEPQCDNEPYSIMHDLLSSCRLTDQDKIFLQSQLDGDIKCSELTRKRKWTRAIGLRFRLERSGYGV